MIVIDPSADRLEELERAYPDPRVTYLIGDGVVIPLPDARSTRLLGERLARRSCGAFSVA